MKRCATCRELKELSAFNVMRSSEDGRQARCRDCCKAWYLANSAQQKAAVTKRNKRHRREVQQWLGSFLAEHPCVDCGEDDIRCLDFDHRPGELKLTEVGNLVRQTASLAKIQREIGKCDVRCAKRHRRRTAERASYWRQGVQEEAERLLHASAARRLNALFS